MKDFLLGLAHDVREKVKHYAQQAFTRSVDGDSPGGDAQFDIDKIAEDAVVAYVRQHAPMDIAIYTEDQSLITIGKNPRAVLVIDPIDGTRPASAGLEMGMISIAHAPLRQDKTRLADVDHALLMEIKSGAWIYGDRVRGLTSSGFQTTLPHLSQTRELNNMFWSIEFNGHPMALMANAYGKLVDRSANSGAVFIFNSASYSISRIITGQLDAYVDIGNRILKDHPQTEILFREAGRGSILHLFPYDIAAAVFLAELAGVTITDAYGNSLGDTDLLDIRPANQQSCIAAATPELHQALLAEIFWHLPELGAAI